LRGRPIARHDNVADPIHADGCRIGADGDHDCVADDVASAAGGLTEQREALSRADPLLGATIDHHQSPRRAERLTLIGEHDPGRVVVHGGPPRIGSANRFWLERREKIILPQLVAGVHHDRHRRPLGGCNNLHQASRVLADDLRTRRSTNVEVTASDEISAHFQSILETSIDGEHRARRVGRALGVLSTRSDRAKRFR